ncbi:MAG TPA: hypothetical protein VJT31_09455 [Rugosimonospora sp.]|nr:hypothetical protein [Rugosimonospora sp.]
MSRTLVSPNPGDVVHLDSAASVQFAGGRALTAEVIGVSHVSRYRDWVWLEVLVLHPPAPAGETVREVFVQRAAVCPGRSLPGVNGY